MRITSKLSTSFHLVQLSPWPLLLSFTIANFLFVNVLIYWQYNFTYASIINFILLLTILSLWFYDINNEVEHHTTKVNDALYLGFLLFVLSEIIAFSTLFGSYLYNSIIPSVEIYNIYPYYGIYNINIYSIPVINTLLLLLSGITCTVGYKLLQLNGNWKTYLIITLILASLFMYAQSIEYTNAFFTIIDGIYATNFFILTGFHGFHVIIGILFLVVNIFIKYPINYYNLSSVYWHFVDLVWIVLVVLLYLI
jgi:cytochrome c oxidase subunit 3